MTDRGRTKPKISVVAISGKVPAGEIPDGPPVHHNAKRFHEHDGLSRGHGPGEHNTEVDDRGTQPCIRIKGSKRGGYPATVPAPETPDPHHDRTGIPLINNRGKLPVLPVIPAYRTPTGRACRQLRELLSLHRQKCSLDECLEHRRHFYRAHGQGTSFGLLILSIQGLFSYYDDESNVFCPWYPDRRTPVTHH